MSERVAEQLVYQQSAGHRLLDWEPYRCDEADQVQDGDTVRSLMDAIYQAPEFFEVMALIHRFLYRRRNFARLWEG